VTARIQHNHTSPRATARASSLQGNRKGVQHNHTSQGDRKGRPYPITYELAALFTWFSNL
jgi:hypothetical protein